MTNNAVNTWESITLDLRITAQIQFKSSVSPSPFLFLFLEVTTILNLVFVIPMHVKPICHLNYFTYRNSSFEWNLMR